MSRYLWFQHAGSVAISVSFPHSAIILLHLPCVRDPSLQSRIPHTHTHTNTPPTHTLKPEQQDTQTSTIASGGRGPVVITLLFLCWVLLFYAFNLRSVQFGLFVLSPAHNLLFLFFLFVSFRFAGICKLNAGSTHVDCFDLAKYPLPTEMYRYTLRVSEIPFTHRNVSL